MVLLVLSRLLGVLHGWIRTIYGPYLIRERETTLSACSNSGGGADNVACTHSVRMLWHAQIMQQWIYN